MKLRDSLAENNAILYRPTPARQEAVKLSVDLLVKADVVEPRYYQPFWMAWRSTAPIS